MLTRCMEKGRVSTTLARWLFLCLCQSAITRGYIVHVTASVCVWARVRVHVCERACICVCVCVCWDWVGWGIGLSCNVSCIGVCVKCAYILCVF